ncbi:MAG: site-specific integrase [Candidatus Accumulibacter sp.]|jgi:integrase|nr:site-specific integrase [Accumulibacter sp.]
MTKAFTKLTRPAMRKLAAKEKISEQGITFERQPDGDGVFSVGIMADGQRIHRVIGRESEGTTRTQAEEFIAKIRNDAKHDRLSLPKGRKVALSFREAAAKYLEKLRESGGKDMRQKTARLKHHLVPFFGDMPLSKISSFDVERYKKQRLQERSDKKPDGKTTGRIPESTYKPGTINRELAVLSHLYSMAETWGWIDRRPKIKRFPEGQGRITFLTTGQVARMIECAKADSSPLIFAYIFIGVETSMRNMEILSIRKEHVDVDRRVIYIPKAKAGAREQPITQALADFLRGYITAVSPGSPWLFSSPSSKSGHLTDIRKPFVRVVEAAGLAPRTVVRHTLRHTAITHLVQAGVDLPTVKRISGHKTLAMVERYAHQSGAHIDEAMAKLQKRLQLVA